MKELKVLIIENDKSDIQIYQDSIRTINADNKGVYKIIETIKENKDDGLKAIEEENWVAAFIDLKLSTGDILKADEGNEIINAIYQKLRFPVFVLTNTPADVNNKFKKSYLLRISSKDSIDHLTVFNEIIDIYKTGISEILGGKGIIEQYISKIFWQNLNGTLKYWIDQKISEEVLKKIILRFTLTHLQENLNRNEIGDFEMHHPSDFYIYPPVNNDLFTGDIVKYKDQFYIVLTPACDLVIRNYAEYLKGISPKRNSNTALLVKLVEINSIDGLEDVPSSDALMKKLGEKKKKQQYYFIPPFMNIGGYLIDFRDCNTFSIEEIQQQSKSIATVSSSYLKDVVASFSYYYSRQGAPEINAGYISEELFDIYYSKGVVEKKRLKS